MNTYNLELLAPAEQAKLLDSVNKGFKVKGKTQTIDAGVLKPGYLYKMELTEA
jgi:hypothetical protein